MSALSRRQLLRRGAGVAAAAAVGAPAIGASGAAADEAALAGVPTGTALIGVNNGSTRWLDNVVNQDTSTTLQSFAFDSTNGHFYTVQIAGAGQIAYLKSGAQVAVTSSISGDQHSAAGDMCLTRHSLTGASTGFMYLLGFGHGVSIGIEPAAGGNPAYVWTEANAGHGGYGNEVVRFPFTNQTVLWTSHPAVQRLPLPEPGAILVTPSVDAVHGILLLRYIVGGVRWFAAYDLATARAAAAAPASSKPAYLGTPLAKIRQPTLYAYDADGQPTSTAATFQGFTSYGPYLYLLDGVSRTTAPSSTLTGVDKWAIHTTSMDINGTQNDASTGYIMSTHSEADAAADPREPEGMAIYTGSGAPRLCFGITDNTSTGTRRFDLYYKV